MKSTPHLKCGGDRIMYVILVYDISTDYPGAKISRKVFKECKKYLHHIQKSVFEGELTISQYAKLETNLKKIVRQDKDSIIVFYSRSKQWLDKEFWGLIEDKTSIIL
jgi:CRISPR-associated protein Cas2